MLFDNFCLYEIFIYVVLDLYLIIKLDFNFWMFLIFGLEYL